MFTYLNFTFGSFFIGLIVTLIAAILILVSANLWSSKRRHTPLSYCVAILFAIILFVLNVTFCGLVQAHNALDDIQHSAEYRIMNNGVDLLNSYDSELGMIAAAFIGDDISQAAIEREKKEISKYMWTDGVLCVMLLFVGMWATYIFTKKVKSKASTLDEEDLLGYEEDNTSTKYYEY